MNSTRHLLFAVILVSGNVAMAAEIDFAKDIQPILQKSCLECHGPDKQKGDLRLDSRKAALKGGKDGPSIVPGNAAKSDLYRRIILPESDDDRMPNKGEPLAKAKTDLIRDWINQGAVWPGSGPAEETPVVTAPTLEPGPKPTAAESKAIAELAKAGIDVREIAQNLNWRQANFRVAGTNFDAKAFVQLKSIPSLYELDLGGVKLTDADLANISGLKNLTKLHLEHTAVTDAGLAHLKGLTKLTYLNLFDTAVTDGGIKQLAGLIKLKSLYVFQTKVTAQGANELKKSLPALYIDLGWEFPTAAAKDAAEKAKKVPKEN